MFFGLFDPPDKIIGKKIPPSAQLEYNAVLSFVDVTCVAENHKKLSFMRGIVGSVWACNSALAGKFELSKFDWDYIKNLGANYSRLLNDENWRECEKAILALGEKGIIPLFEKQQ